MTIKGKVASFAHLLGISAKKAEEDEDKKRDDETDEDYAKRMEDKKDKEEKAKKAEEDDDAARKAEEEEKQQEEDATKAKKAEEDEDDKEKAARKSERARCRTIFSAASAGSRPDMAAHLAFDTDMDAKDAVALLDVATAGATGRPGLGARMSNVSLPKVGADAGAIANSSSAQGTAAQIIAAGKKRRGEA
jgi:cobalamin biosynthesis protein CobT